MDTVVIHTTEGGSVQGALEHWQRCDVHASAHYIIDGRSITQAVPEGFAAYHAGNGEVNRRSIGIEVVGRHDRRETWTPDVLAQLVALTADVCQRHGVHVLHGCPGIIGHEDVPDPLHPRMRGGAAHHKDPGPFFPWQEFIDDVRALVAGGDPLPPSPFPKE